MPWGLVFDEAFPYACRVGGGEVRALESFCRFEVGTSVENRFLLKSFALVYMFPGKVLYP